MHAQPRIDLLLSYVHIKAGLEGSFSILAIIPDSAQQSVQLCKILPETDCLPAKVSKTWL